MSEFVYTWIDKAGQLRVSYLEDEDSTKYIRADIAADMLAALEAIVDVGDNIPFDTGSAMYLLDKLMQCREIATSAIALAKGTE